MRKKAMNERAVRVNVSLAPETLERIDKNVERIARWMLRKGADEKEVRKSVNRSALIKEMVESLGTDVKAEYRVNKRERPHIRMNTKTITKNKAGK